MTRSTAITDPAFDRLVTLRDAYHIMERFLDDYHVRGETETGVLLGYFAVMDDGIPGDPAALDDYLAAAQAILKPPAA